MGLPSQDADRCATRIGKRSIESRVLTNHVVTHHPHIRCREGVEAGDIRLVVHARSRIENVGIITVAIGLFVIGRATDVPMIAALGLAAAIAHVWNHSLFMGLLFLCAGSVLHATGTRRIDRMGGLLQRMPTTGTAFVIGAIMQVATPTDIT